MSKKEISIFSLSMIIVTIGALVLVSNISYALPEEETTQGTAQSEGVVEIPGQTTTQEQDNTTAQGAEEEKVQRPRIISIEENKAEDLAITVTWDDSVNKDIVHSIELKEETTGQINRLSSEETKYTYQGLDIDKTYKIKIRACTSDEEEDCSPWSGLHEKKYDKGLKAIIMNYKSIALLENATEELKILFYIPSRTYHNKTVTWSTSNAEIATVDAQGIVTAKKEGTAIITATTVNGKTVTCEVKVTKVPVPLQSITLNEKSITINQKTKKTLSVTYNPADTTDKRTITWKSSNPAIATVDQRGVVTGVAVGGATISATTEGGKVAVCTVVVKPAPAAQSGPTSKKTTKKSSSKSSSKSSNKSSSKSSNKSSKSKNKSKSSSKSSSQKATKKKCGSHEHLNNKNICICDSGYTRPTGSKNCVKTYNSSSKSKKSTGSSKSSSKKTTKKKSYSCSWVFQLQYHAGVFRNHNNNKTCTKSIEGQTKVDVIKRSTGVANKYRCVCK